MNNFLIKLNKFFHSVHFKIALVFTLLSLGTLIVIGLIFTTQYRSQTLANFKSQVTFTSQTRKTVANILQGSDEEAANKEINDTLSNLTGVSTDDKILVIDKNKIIRGATSVEMKSNVGSKYTTVFQSKAVREMIQIALTTTVQKKLTSEFNTRGADYFMVTYPLLSTDGKTIGIIVALSDMTSTYDRMERVSTTFWQSLLIPFVLSTVLAYFVARWLTNPLEILDKQTQNLIESNYQTENHIRGNDEIARLANRINTLSNTLLDETEKTTTERARLESLLSNMTDGVLAINRNGDILIANIAAAELFGLSQKDIENVNINDLFDLKDQGISLREILQSQNGVTLENIPSTDGSILKITSSLIRRQSGFITGAVFVIRDVTDEVEIEKQQKDFVSNVSHELRTPLTSVNSYIETLQDGALSQRKVAHEFLDTAHNETQRMIRMINDLVELSRIDQNNLKLDMEFVNITRFMDYILNRFNVIVEQGNTVHDKKYEIIKKYKQNDLFVDIDTDRFTQVIDNIVNNAINYSPDGSKIEVNIKKERQNVVISIRDHGMGIPKKDLKNVFGRFYRVDKARARKQGGSGLGLSISKEVVEALGGRIWVESKNSNGTTMFISLPLVKDEELIEE